MTELKLKCPKCGNKRYKYIVAGEGFAGKVEIGRRLSPSGITSISIPDISCNMRMEADTELTCTYCEHSGKLSEFIEGFDDVYQEHLAEMMGDHFKCSN